MAQDEIILKLRVEDGELKRASASIDKQSKKIDKNTKKKKQGTRATNNYNKAEKALYQSNLSSSKAFSKMNQTMGGSSGVVAAYATLAANVFALTAAFGALSRAAEFSTLEQGLVQLGAASGQTLSVMAEGLREITGGAISAEQAMRGAALGVSGGFGGEELKGLAEIAKGASITLGRDLADAFDRLTRGAIKLEPEILDELGIMVRLDDAVENYAAQIGKTAGSLTQMERRQAFMNAILVQGEEKFGAIARQTDPNPYARLGATFGDLAKNIFEIINKFTGLQKVVGYLADNIWALFGVMVLFGSTIAGKMLPFLADSAKRAADAASGMRDLANAAALAQKQTQIGLAGRIVKSDVGSEGFKQAIKGYAVGTSLPGGTKEGAIKALTKGQTVLNQGISRYRTMLKGANAEKTIYFNQQIMQYEIEAAHLQGLIDLETGKGQAAVLASRSQVLAVAGEEAAEAIEFYQAGAIALVPTLETLGGQYEGIRKGLLDASGSMKHGGTVAQAYNKVLASVTARMKVMGFQAKVLGAALLKALPLIGVLLTVAAIGYGIFQKLWNTEEQKEYNEQQKKLNKILENQVKIGEKYRETIEGSGRAGFVQLTTLKQTSGAVKEMNKALKETIKLRKEADKSKPGSTRLGVGRWRAENIAQDLTTTDTRGSGPMSFNEQATTSTYEKQTKRFGSAVADVLSGLESGRDKWEIANLLEIEDSAEFQTFKTAMEHEIPHIADLAAIHFEEVMGKSFDTPRERAEELKNRFELMERQLGGVGAAATGIAEGLKEAEKEASKFNTSFAKTTKVSELGKQLRSMSKNIKLMGEEVKKSGIGDEAIMIGRSLSQVGTTMAKMVGQDFYNQMKSVNAIEEKILKNKNDTNISARKRKKIEKDLKKELDAQMAILGGKGMVKEYNNLVDLVNEIERSEITTKDTLNKIAASSKIINGLKDSTVNLTKLENKLLNEKVQQERELTQLQLTLIEKQFTTATNTGEAIKSGKKILLATGEQLKVEKLREMSAEEQIILAEQLGIDLGLVYSMEQANILINTKLMEEFRNRLRESVLERQRAAEITIKQNAVEKAGIAIRLKGMLDQAKLKNFASGKGAKLSPAQEAVLKIRAAKEEYEMKKITFEADKEMIKTKAELQKIDLLILEEQLRYLNMLDKPQQDALAAARNSIDSLATSEIWNIEDELSNSKAGITVALAEVFDDAMTMAAGGDGLDAIAIAIASAKHEDSLGATGKDDDIGGRNITMAESVGILQVAATAGATALKELGPGGEAYATAVGGMSSIAGGFLMVAEAGEDSAQRIKGIMQTISGMGNVMSGISKARVEALDQEIAAEEKRDGKSAKSLAKIKALKKKKYEMEKKSFEQDKKIKMANALISTYAGVARALDEEPPLSYALAAATLAMGMMQVKAISQTKFSGTPPSEGDASPPSITIGKRSNKVDVSRAASAGELAYLRGQRGIGTTATNFIPQGGAAGLRKGYASGGEILVGERGPEVIRPTAEGYTVVPNDALGGKSVVNASFEIHAIDAAGVEEVLVEQQGNIINMIRSAANDHGQEFLEEVDTTVYGGTPRSPGGIDY